MEVSGKLQIRSVCSLDFVSVTLTKKCQSHGRREPQLTNLPLDWLVGMSVWHCWLMWEGPALKGGGPERFKEGS